MIRFFPALVLTFACIGFSGCGGSGDLGPPTGAPPENIPAEVESAAEAPS